MTSGARTASGSLVSLVATRALKLHGTPVAKGATLSPTNALFQGVRLTSLISRGWFRVVGQHGRGTRDIKAFHITPADYRYARDND